MTTFASYVESQIRLVCPIIGLSVGDPANKTTWRISYDPSATSAQQAAGQGVIDGMDLVAASAAVAASNDQNDTSNMTKIFRAKCISDLAFRLGVLPGALTPAQKQAERDRIKSIADALP